MSQVPGRGGTHGPQYCIYFEFVSIILFVAKMVFLISSFFLLNDSQAALREEDAVNASAGASDFPAGFCIGLLVLFGCLLLSACACFEKQLHSLSLMPHRIVKAEETLINTLILPLASSSAFNHISWIWRSLLR